MTSDRGAWGPLLRQYRERAGLSATAAGAAVGTTAATMYVYESGNSRPAADRAKALATAYGCNEIETAELLDTLGTPAPTKARAQTSGVVLPIAPPAGQPIQDWHTRLVRMASFATTAARAGMTPADLAELLAFIGQPQRGDTPEDATLAYVAQALDEFGAPPADIEQLRRAVHRVVDQWLDWTRKRRGTMLVEVSGMEGAK